MSAGSLTKGARLRWDGQEFVLVSKISPSIWQMQAILTGEFRQKAEMDLIEMYRKGELKILIDESRIAARMKGGRVQSQEVVFSDLPESVRDTAKTRRLYAEAVLTYAGVPGSGASVCALIKEVWQKHGRPAKCPHPVTVWRWAKRYVECGRDIRALVDNDRRKGNYSDRFPQEVLNIVAETIQRLYMTMERRTAKDVLDDVIRVIGAENRLRLPSDLLPVPKESLISRMIGEIDKFDLYASRHGKEAAERHFRTVLKRPVPLRPLDRAEIDHTRLDLFVVDDLAYLPLGRPWLTACIDGNSRVVLGIDLSFEPPSFNSVARCLAHAILPKENARLICPEIKGNWDAYGIMTQVAVDNGMEFHSHSLEEACLVMGIELLYCPRKTPWFKGKVERFLGTLNREIGHGNPGTTFESIVSKGDYDPAKHAVITLTTLKKIIHLWVIDHYHQRPHKGLGGDLPSHAWRSGTAGMEIPLPSDPNQLRAVLGYAATRVLTHRGIEINNLFYNSTEAGELVRRLGHGLDVEVRWSADDMGEIYVKAPDMGGYFPIPAVDFEYASGMTLWQHKVCRRYAQRNLEGRADPAALAKAKETIRVLIEKDFFNKKKRNRQRAYRFLAGQGQLNQPFGEKTQEEAAEKRAEIVRTERESASAGTLSCMPDGLHTLRRSQCGSIAEDGEGLNQLPAEERAGQKIDAPAQKWRFSPRLVKKAGGEI